MKAPIVDDLLLLEEVAARARVSISTVRHWIATGKLESVRPGRRRLIRAADLRDFLERDGSALEHSHE